MPTLPIRFDLNFVAGFVRRTLKKTLKRSTVGVQPALAPVKVQRHGRDNFPPSDGGTLR